MSEVVMCSKCKTWVSPGAKTCPKCGAPIVTQEMLNQAIVQKDEAQLQKKRNTALILSLIIFFVVMFMSASGVSNGGFLDFLASLPAGAVVGWIVGGIPCGWVGTEDNRKKISWMWKIIPIGTFIWLMAVLALAYFGGLALFPAYLVKFIINIIKKKKA